MPSAETYHITWTCYGQWLHGDARGYVDSRHRTPGTPYEHNDPHLAAQAGLAEACAFRGWRLWAVNAQPDHVHVVVEAPGIDGKRVRHVLKDRGTRILQPTEPGRQHWWTEGGKVDRITSEKYLRAAVVYVNEKQPYGRIGPREYPAASAAGSGGKARGEYPAASAAGSGIDNKGGSR
jgi:REP element-mobilizing transposase RayT